MHKWYVVAVIVVIILVLWFADGCSKQTKNSQMVGVWSAPSEFCAASGIDGMIVYLGDEYGFLSKKRKACLVMHSDDVTIAYKIVEIDFGMLDIFGGLLAVASDKIKYDVSITELEEDEESEISFEDIMPENLTIEYDPVKMCMEWKDGDKLFAKLYKDCAASDL